MTKKSVSDRLARQSPIGVVISLRGLTQSDVAARMGITRQAVQRWACGAPPSLANLRKLAEILDVPLTVLTGEVPIEEDDFGVQEEAVPLVISTLRADGLDDDGRKEQEDGVFKNLSLNPKALFPEVLKPAIVNIVDDAMAPTLKPGDAAIIETVIRFAPRAGLYAVQIQGKARVRRLRPNVDGSMTLLFDNPLYPAETVDEAQMKHLSVLGIVTHILKLNAA